MLRRIPTIQIYTLCLKQCVVKEHIDLLFYNSTEHTVDNILCFMSKRPLKSAAGLDNERIMELIRSHFHFFLGFETVYKSRCKSHLQVRKLLKFSLMEKIFLFIHIQLTRVDNGEPKQEMVVISYYHTNV